jgi:AAA15 family ATPase/GTPase
MRIIAIELENIRGFKNLPRIDLSESINVFIGPNNAGKSTILNSVFMLQRRVFGINDVTIGQAQGKIRLFYQGSHSGVSVTPSYNHILFNLKSSEGRYIHSNGATGEGFLTIPENEPYNLIYPYLSKRKATDYIDAINEKNANSVSGNFVNLYSKIDRLITPQFQPGNQQYVEACRAVLGFEVSTLAKGTGKKAVYFIYNMEHIPLTAMGEGVANILGLITDLCIAENRIFLIEEPENDIHPKALKALLRLIIEKSKNNQFFISTHSNIVMKFLGGIKDAKLFNVSNDIRDTQRPNLFLSNISEIANNPEARRQVLEDLGYDFFDFDLWKGWLFLEESSAEIIIREYLIDWFVPSLKSKLRTFSAGGVSSVMPKFDDFDRLFIFLHMEPSYRNKVWVIIDSGIEEKQIIERMQSKYSNSGWSASNFSQFSEHEFERYLPSEFQTKVDEIFKISDKRERQQAKKGLLLEVISWIKSDEKSAKAQFKISAKEVIDRLIEIDMILNRN